MDLWAASGITLDATITTQGLRVSNEGEGGRVMGGMNFSSRHESTCVYIINIFFFFF